jgi:hypothetical protein
MGFQSRPKHICGPKRLFTRIRIPGNTPKNKVDLCRTQVLREAAAQRVIGRRASVIEMIRRLVQLAVLEK